MKFLFVIRLFDCIWTLYASSWVEHKFQLNWHSVSYYFHLQSAPNMKCNGNYIFRQPALLSYLYGLICGQSDFRFLEIRISKRSQLQYPSKLNKSVEWFINKSNLVTFSSSSFTITKFKGDFDRVQCSQLFTNLPIFSSFILSIKKWFRW